MLLNNIDIKQASRYIKTKSNIKVTGLNKKLPDLVKYSPRNKVFMWLEALSASPVAIYWKGNP